MESTSTGDNPCPAPGKSIQVKILAPESKYCHVE